MSRFARVLFLVLALVPASPLHADPLSLVGTGDGLDIFLELARRFTSAYPEQSVVVPPSIGSGGAIAAVGAGRERAGRIARPLTPVEVASGLISRPVFSIPSAIYVHPGVSLRNLTNAQLRGIFDGSVTNWSALGGPDRRIRVVRREESDSVLSVLRATMPAFRDLVITERSKLALTTQDAIASIRDNEGAIGFAPYSTATAGVLGVVAVDGLLPTQPAYPSRVQLALIWREGRMGPDLERFLTFLASAAGREAVTAFGAVSELP